MQVLAGLEPVGQGVITVMESKSRWPSTAASNTPTLTSALAPVAPLLPPALCTSVQLR